MDFIRSHFLQNPYFSITIKEITKFLLLLCHIVFATENGNYLSILDQLDMSNLMIVGEFGYLRNRKMFHLIKKLSRILKIPKVCSYR